MERLAIRQELVGDVQDINEQVNANRQAQSDQVAQYR